MSSFDELPDAELQRLADMFAGRDVEIFLPRSIERRLRALMHRLNAEIQANDEDDTLYDPRDELDVNAVLINVAERGLLESERKAGTIYSPATGLTLDVVGWEDE